MTDIHDIKGPIELIFNYWIIIIPVIILILIILYFFSRKKSEIETIPVKEKYKN